MHIARALRFASYPVVLAVGEPLWTYPFSCDHRLVGSAGFLAWGAAYVVFTCDFGALSLVVLASQAALVLPRRHTAVFVAAQTAVL